MGEVDLCSLEGLLLLLLSCSILWNSMLQCLERRIISNGEIIRRMVSLRKNVNDFDFHICFELKIYRISP